MILTLSLERFVSQTRVNLRTMRSCQSMQGMKKKRSLKYLTPISQLKNAEKYYQCLFRKEDIVKEKKYFRFKNPEKNHFFLSPVL